MKTTQFDKLHKSSEEVSVQFIRNATLVVNYNGYKILVDPMFSEKGAFNSFAGKENNPTIDLAVSISDITLSLDLVLVTHTHPDHFDGAASHALDKSITLFHQPSDTAYFLNAQFVNASSIMDRAEWNDIEISRVKAQHGSGDVLNFTGEASGFILRAKGNPTIYIVGDGIWTEDIRTNIHQYNPDYIIVNSGGAVLPVYPDNLILMDEEQTLKVIKEAPQSTIIAVHMEALDHCLVTRSSLRAKAKESKIELDKLIIPQDGQTIRLSHARVLNI